MYKEYAPDELEVLKVKLLKDLTFFIRFFFKQLSGSKFLLNWHHADIAHELNEIYERKNDNLIINIPPRHSKTEMAIMFVAWSLAKNPASLFLFISASDKLSTDNSKRVRDVVNLPIYKQLFDTTITVDTKAKNHWRTNKGGGITTATINGQLTGFGAGRIADDKEFYGAIIIDDPNKINAEGSAILSTEPNQRFNDTIRSRRNGKRTPIILIQQRAFVDDLSGFLLDGAGALKFKHLCLPVIVDGEALWPDKMDLTEINAIRTHPDTSHMFNSQYMQDPTESKGLVFPVSKLNRFKRSELNQTPDAKYAFGDVADQGNDYFSLPIAEMHGKKIFITDVVYTQDGEEITQPIVMDKFNTQKIQTAIFESNNMGKIYASSIRKIIEAEEFTGFDTDVKWLPAKGHKVTRIVANSGWILEHCYFLDNSEYELNSEYDKFIKHLTKYNKEDGLNQVDDSADSMALLAWYIRIKFEM